MDNDTTSRVRWCSPDEVPLSPWAAWLWAVGRAAGHSASSDERLTIVLTVPVRDLGPSFLLLGVVEALAERKPDVVDHWKMLTSLPDGTWVRHLDRGKYYTCSTLQGIEERNGQEWLRLGGPGNLRRWDKCLDVQPLQPGEPPFRLRHAPRDQAFLNALLPEADVRAYCASSKPLAVTVGSRSALLAEFEETRISVRTDAGGAEGSVAEILRPRIQPGSPYRVDLVSAAAEAPPERLNEEVPVAVFDGAPAVLRWRNKLSSRAKIYLLDRTSASYDAAVDAVLSDRARSIADANADLLARPTQGIEVMAYLERP